MKDKVSIWFEAVSGSLETLLSAFAAFIPSLLAAIIILLVGYIVSRILRTVVGAILRKIGVDKLADSTGIDEHLGRLGKKASVSNGLALLVFWIVFLIFIVSAADSLGLDQLGETIDQFIVYIPKIFAATLILLLGLAAASLIKNLVHNSAKSAGFDFAKPLSKAAFALVAILTISLTIGQLEIETRLLDTIVGIVLAALGIGCAISLGLGSRRASENIVYSVYIAEAVKIGDKVTLKDGLSGSVVEIGAVVTTIRTEDESLKLVDNQDFLSGLSIH